MRIPLAIGALLAAAAMTPALASAHTATVTCIDGGYVVTPDAQYRSIFQGSVLDGAVAHLTWTDGYTKDIALPSGCVVPGPTPAPVPAVPELMPVVVVTPSPVVPVVPVVPKVSKPKVDKTSCRWLIRHHAGVRSFARAGHYYMCKAPVQRVPRRIAVTG